MAFFRQEEAQPLKMFLLYLRRLVGKQSPLSAPAAPDSSASSTPLRLLVAQHTDIGQRRSKNEDNLLTVLPDNPRVLQEKGALFVVADGMGGHARGERASELAVQGVCEAYYQQESTDISASLARALKQANTQVYQENALRSNTSSSRTKMGTTCIAAVLQQKTLTVANVGDSRAYIVRAGQIRQISQDHSLVAEMMRVGALTPEQVNSHANRNLITRALGFYPNVEVDMFMEVIEEGDALLLCTDGLSGLVEEAEMRQIVETYEPQEGVQQLIDRANAVGGFDNITAIIVRVAPQTGE